MNSLSSTAKKVFLEEYDDRGQTFVVVYVYSASCKIPG